MIENKTEKHTTMKRISILAALLLITISSFAQSGKSIYEKYSDEKDVSAVYISPAMFRLIGKIPEIKADAEGGSIDLAPIISSLSGMYILESENKAINASLYSDVQKFISARKYELLMEAKDNGEVMRMYTIGDEKTVTGFVMIGTSDDETTFISFEGKINRSDLEKILAKQMD